MADAAATPTSPTSAPSPGVTNPALGYLNAEAKRTLTSPVYSSTGPSSIDLPRDTCLKRLTLKLSASTSVTYGSGSPTLGQMGVFDRLCSYVEITVNGLRLIKSIRPHIARLNNILVNGSLPRRTYQNSNAAATNTRAGFDFWSGTLAFNTTTHFMYLQEAIELYFENPWGYGGSRHISELDLRDAASATCKFNWQNFTNLQQDGVGAAVTYGSTSAVVSPVTTENRARPRPQPNQVLMDYVETYFSKGFSAQASSQSIDLQTGNYLMGVGVFCTNGDTNQTPQENLLTNMILQINGATSMVGPISHQDLQDLNQIRHSVFDPFGIDSFSASAVAGAAGDHPLAGFAHINLIRNGDWNSAINTSRAAGVDSVKLLVNTPGTSGTDAATYTNNLLVTLHTHEIRPYVYTR